MDISIGLLLIVIGFISGAYGIIVGAGGGFIFVPALLLIMHLPPKIAAGTGLVVVLLNSISGLYGFIKQRRVDYRLGINLFIGALPGSIFGVWLTNRIPTTSFYWIFAIILIGLGVFLYVKKEPNEQSLETEEEHVVNKFSIITTGILLGTVSSFFGVGGGWLLVPILIYIFGVKPHIATATSIFSLSLYCTIGVGLHWYAGDINWVAVLWGGIGVIAGAQLGVYLSKRITGRAIVQMLAFLLIVIGVQLIMK